MSNFMQKLMFWRKTPDGQASGGSPSGPNDGTSLAPEELEYQAESEEKLLEERRDEDDLAP